MKKLKKIFSLYDKYKEVINYLIFGFLTTVISLIVYYALTFSVVNPDNAFELQIANILSWVAGVSFAYVTNRKYVFKSNNSNVKRELFSFVGSRVITLLMDMFIMGLFVTILGFNDKIMKIISQVIVIVSNYFFSKIIVFKKQK